MDKSFVPITTEGNSYGTFMQIGHAAVAEILAQAGFQWIAVDMEHSDISVERFTDLCRAIDAEGSIPLARVRNNDVMAIRQVMDQGAAGVIVPLVETADEARQAVSAAKYPPIGQRGFSFHRANGYSRHFADDIAMANDHGLVLVMIESRLGVENVEEILAVDGVDGIFMGPYDLSGSLGLIGQLDHPDVRKAMDRCVRVCRSADKIAGTHVAHPTGETLQHLREAGYQFFGLGYDSLFLSSRAREVYDAIRITD